VATFLYRLGRFSYRRRGLVALIWLAMLVTAGVGAATLSGETSDSFEIPGTESQQAFDLLEERFPDAPSADNTAARVVFAAPEGQSLTDPENRAIVDDAVVLPFEWRGIDAYYYSEGFAPLWEGKGATSEPLSPGHFIEGVSTIVDRTKRTGGYTALLFHPFLENTPARFDAMARIIEMVVQDSDIWCAPCRDIAEWVSAKRASFPNDPGLDLTSWARRS
jgi:hypothetical protein